MSTANAPGGDHEYAKTLRWWDGFTISLSIPAALFISAGYAMGALGSWTAVALLTCVAVIAASQNLIYSELAAMFPDKVGGISVYANEGWRSRLSIVGPLATYGYWFAWSSSLAIYGLQIGTLVQAEWFAGETWTFSTGLADIGFPHLVAIGVLFLGWAFNVLGMRPAMWVMYATGVLVLIPILAFAILPFATGNWDASLLSWDLGAGGHPSWQNAIAWMFVLAWSVYGIEAVASFVPEFRDTVRDSKIALRLAGGFVLIVYFLVPLGLGGMAPQQAITEAPVTFYVGVFDELLGGGSAFMTVCLIAGLLLLMVMTTADGGRVLHGSAREGLTIRQLGQVNRFKVPGRAMTLDLGVNLILILFVGSTLAVIVAGILGYMLCHVFALSAYVLLRRDRPDAVRPVRLAKQWTYVAGFLALVDLTFVVVGAASAKITGYGGTREVLIALGVLSISVMLYAFRTVVQDGRPFRLRGAAADDEPAVVPLAPELQPEGVA